MSIVTPDKASSIVPMSTLETLGRERLEALVTDWQRLLGLEHWTIRLELILAH